MQRLSVLGRAPSIAMGVVAALELAGCWASHLRADREDGSMRDAAVVRDAAPAPDAATLPDAGTCPRYRAGFACTEGRILPAGRPTSLPFFIGEGDGGCLCPSWAVSCVATVVGDTIDLSPGTCYDPSPCDDCRVALPVQCPLPALAPGRYVVSVEGRASFEIDAMPGDVDDAPRTCSTEAWSNECGYDWAPEDLVADRFCVPGHTQRGQPSFINTFAHLPCNRWPICEVRLEGGRLVAALRTLPYRCPSECHDPFSWQVRCAVPPLEEGTYEVSLLGTGTLTLVVDDTPPGTAPAVCAP